MKLRYFAALLTLSATILFTACEKEKKCEGLSSRTFNLDNFTRISAGSTMRLRINHGNEFSIKADGCSRDINDLFMQVGGGETLQIDFDKPLRNRSEVFIDITLPHLKATNLSGAATADINGFTGGQSNLRVVLSGASKANVNGTTIKTQVELSGASELTTTGNTDLLYGNISGGSELHAFGTASKEIDITTSGGSKAFVTVQEKLIAQATGGSSIRYRGNPKEKELETSGGGQIIQD